MKVYIDNKFYDIIGKLINWYYDANQEYINSNEITLTTETISNLLFVKHDYEQAYNEDCSLIYFQINEHHIYYLVLAIEDAINYSTEINKNELVELRTYLCDLDKR